MSKTIKLTEKTSITLGAVTRIHLMKAMQEETEKRFEALRPKPVEGYTHEIAYQNIESYREEWEAYQTEILNAWVYTMYGLAWKIGGLDQSDEEYETERNAAVAVGKRLGQKVPNLADVVEMGALAYALVELLAGHNTRDEITAWLYKEAGMLDTAAVAEERKSPSGNSEQPAPDGGSKRDKKPRKGRG